ncbi:hypothetical protein ACFX1T_004517 [Malus domestica]
MASMMAPVVTKTFLGMRLTCAAKMSRGETSFGTTPAASATTTVPAIHQRLGTFRRNLKTGCNVDPDALHGLRTILPEGPVACEAEIDWVGAGKAN